MSPRIGTATEAGLDPARLQQTYALLDHWAQSGRVPGGVLAVARQGVLVPPPRLWATPVGRDFPTHGSRRGFSGGLGDQTSDGAG